uniref:SUEL-type lectin domain-containing protein n=1 Tax=Astyanax mexicanus TaxID=7994 RepID=A0A3B1IDC9_ASTMX
MHTLTHSHCNIHTLTHTLIAIYTLSHTPSHAHAHTLSLQCTHTLKPSVTCTRSHTLTQSVTCTRAGVLKIEGANYGRTDSTTCSAGRPTSQITKTDCYATNTLTLVKSKCDGKITCSVPASNSVFSDPCVNTYKYLSMRYTCTTGSGVIKIDSANYGRTDPTTCSAGRPTSQITKTDCYSSNTLSVVKTSCDGKTTCSVPASNSVFSDPCVNTYKFLIIKYFCAVEL